MQFERLESCATVPGHHRQIWAQPREVRDSVECADTSAEDLDGQTGGKLTREA